MNGSWKTTTSGIVGALIVVAQAAVQQIDNGTADWSLAIAAVIGCIGLLMARDKDVSSEGQGLKNIPIIILCTSLFIIGGCSTASSTPDLINDAKEENSGWTDADNRDIRIILSENANVVNSTIEIWIETTSGNARDGRGSAGENATGSTEQTPTNTTEVDVSIPNPITGG